MRRASWTPSIVPNDFDQNVYLVVDDFGRQGLSFHEIGLDRTDLESVIRDQAGLNGFLFLSSFFRHTMKILRY